MREEDKISLETPSGAVCSYGPVVYVVWRSFDQLSMVETADDVVRSLVRRYGDGRKLFYVNRNPEGGGAARQNPELRSAVLKHFERTENLMVGAGVAIEATGFGGSIIRSAAAAVMLMRSSSVPTKTFGDAREAVRWLGGLSREANPFDAEAMIKALEAKGLAKTAAA